MSLVRCKSCAGLTDIEKVREEMYSDDVWRVLDQMCRKIWTRGNYQHLWHTSSWIVEWEFFLSAIMGSWIKCILKKNKNTLAVENLNRPNIHESKGDNTKHKILCWWRFMCIGSFTLRSNNNQTWEDDELLAKFCDGRLKTMNLI